MNAMQEKFQVVLPPEQNEDDGTAWQTAESVRKTYNPGNKLNVIPPGMRMEGANPMPRTLGGASDYSKDANPAAMRDGFRRGVCKPSDESYNGNGAVHFYDEVTDETGNVGFAERGNMFDRI